MTPDQAEERHRERHFALYAQLVTWTAGARVTGEITWLRDDDIAREAFRGAAAFLHLYEGLMAECDRSDSLSRIVGSTTP